jgi:hypothetical protein
MNGFLSFTLKTTLRFRQSSQTFAVIESHNYISGKMAFTIEEKALLLECYFRNGEKQENGDWADFITPCVEEFQARYPNRMDIDYEQVYQCIKIIVPNFRESGSIIKKKSGRPLVRIPEVVQNVRQIVEEHPSTSIRRLRQQINLSYGTCQKILKDINLFPYKIRVLQEIKLPDYPKRMDYCRWFEENMNDEILDLTFFSDEGWIDLGGYVNSQNQRIWSSKNPHEYVHRGLHPQKIGIWIVISRRLSPRFVSYFIHNQSLNKTSNIIIIKINKNQPP